MNGYYELPARVLEDTDELQRWMLRAIDVALRSARRRAATSTASGRQGRS